MNLVVVIGLTPYDPSGSIAAVGGSALATGILYLPILSWVN